LIVHEGGVLSHTAIWARSLGIPAVQCSEASARIPPGTVVQVDGDRGLVCIGAAALAERKQSEA
jgi:phosphohistidine swiveling domain-containing protein